MTRGADGVATPGTVTTIAMTKCRVEVNNSRFVITQSGDRIEYAVTVYCPFMSGAAAIPAGKARFHHNGKVYTVVQVPPLQRTTVLRCS